MIILQLHLLELKSIKFTDTRLGDVLGNGSYGIVMKAEWYSGLFGLWKKDVAIKIIRTEKNDIVVREVIETYFKLCKML